MSVQWLELSAIGRRQARVSSWVITRNFVDIRHTGRAVSPFSSSASPSFSRRSDSRGDTLPQFRSPLGISSPHPFLPPKSFYWKTLKRIIEKKIEEKEKIPANLICFIANSKCYVAFSRRVSMTVTVVTRIVWLKFPRCVGGVVRWTQSETIMIYYRRIGYENEKKSMAMADPKAKLSR